MVDLDNAVIVDVEPSVPIRTAEAFAARRMIDRITDRFDMTPDKLVGDTGYGSAEMLGWLVEERNIAPHIPVWDKSKRTDGTFAREDFVYDPVTDSYTCPGNKKLQTYRRNFTKPRKPNGGKDGDLSADFPPALRRIHRLISGLMQPWFPVLISVQIPAA